MGLKTDIQRLERAVALLEKPNGWRTEHVLLFLEAWYKSAPSKERTREEFREECERLVRSKLATWNVTLPNGWEQTHAESFEQLYQYASPLP